jgi:uncharacterized protein YecE (DUF72 family)
MLKLRNVETALANFFASGLLRLRAKLGPILWQFPPQLAFDEARFTAFFDLLPHDGAAALALARRHDRRVEGRTWLEVDLNRPLRHAIEVRHQSFVDPRFISLLRRHRIALVVADTAGRWPLMEDITADFVYVRLHGDQELYASGYSDLALDAWARRIDAWQRGIAVADALLVAPVGRRSPRGVDVYCYFDNDVKVHAPYDAARLAARLGIATGVDSRSPSDSRRGPDAPRRRASVFGKRSPAQERRAPREAKGRVN